MAKRRIICTSDPEKIKLKLEKLYAKIEYWIKLTDEEKKQQREITFNKKSNTKHDNPFSAS